MKKDELGDFGKRERLKNVVRKPQKDDNSGNSCVFTRMVLKCMSL